MKYLSWFAGFFIAGFIFGLIFFGGATHDLQNSQKNKIPLIIPLSVGIIAGVIGISFASKIVNEDKKKESLGLNNIETLKYKDVRKWVYCSEWLDPANNEKNQIKTFYDINLGSTISTFNGNLIQNHNTNSGADSFISKMHYQAQARIIKELLSK